MKPITSKVKVLVCCGCIAAAGLAGPVLRASNINYTYDSASRLVGVDYGTNRTASYAYDKAGNLLQTSQPSPGLQIGAIIGNQFTLLWPATPGGFVLQSAASLDPGAIWTNEAAPTLTNGLNLVMVTFSGTKYYRLKKL